MFLSLLVTAVSPYPEHISGIIKYMSLSDLDENLWVCTCCCKWHDFILFCGWVICCYICVCIYIYVGFSGGAYGKEPNCQCRRHRRCGVWWSDSWVRKMPWRRAWPPTPVFLHGESPCTEPGRGVAIVHRITQSQTWLKRLGMHTAFWAVSYYKKRIFEIESQYTEVNWKWTAALLLNKPPRGRKKFIQTFCSSTWYGRSKQR